MIVIIDYGVGNVGSIANMLKKVGVPAIISSDAAAIARADKLILPGVGAFDACMKNLMERNLIPLLKKRVVEDHVPILGLCVGLQLFARSSTEGQLPGLGWLDGETVRFQFDQANASLKVPHMGWNTLEVRQPHPLLADLNDDVRFYFVHSYHVVCQNPRDVLAVAHHGYDFAAVVAHGNIMGVQFHPEKSHRFGMQLYRNFAERM